MVEFSRIMRYFFACACLVASSLGCYRARPAIDAGAPDVRDGAALEDALIADADGETPEASVDADGAEPEEPQPRWLCDPELTANSVRGASLSVDADGAAVLLVQQDASPRRLYRGALSSPLSRWLVTEVNSAYAVESCEGCSVYELTSSGCGLRRLSETESTCELSVADPALTLLSPTLAFAAYDGRIMHYDGIVWRQVGVRQSVTGFAKAIWSDGTDIVLAGSAGVVRGRLDVPFTPITGALPSVVHDIGLAGESASDLWWIGRGELWHFDGANWSRVWESQCPTRANGLVQLEDRVVFWGETFVGSVPIGSVTPTARVDCLEHRKFLAASPSPHGDAILVAAEDTTSVCGSITFWTSVESELRAF